MYFPQSQIKENLYSNGELSYKSDNKPYIGYYFSTSTGFYFTGKNPQDTPNVELIVNNKSNLEIDYLIQPDTRFSTKDNYTYSINKNIQMNGNRQTIPLFFQTLPTSDDYTNGEFVRYFTKKTNEIIYIEINKDTYQKLTDKDSTLFWDLYFPFSLSWKLTGTKESVFKINKNIVELTMKRLNLPMFNLYLKKDYTKYFN